MRRNEPHIKGAAQCTPRRWRRPTAVHSWAKTKCTVCMSRSNIHAHSMPKRPKTLRFCSIDYEMIIMCAPHNHRQRLWSHTHYRTTDRTARKTTTIYVNMNITTILSMRHSLCCCFSPPFHFQCCVLFQCALNSRIETIWNFRIVVTREIVQAIHDCSKANETKWNETKRRK